jgi:hypothetical protein
MRLLLRTSLAALLVAGFAGVSPAAPATGFPSASPQDSAPPPAAPPAPVQGLQARDYVEGDDRGDKIELRWGLSADDGGGAEGVVAYRIWRSTSAGDPGDSLAIVPAGTDSFLDESAVPGLPYFYRVAAAGASSLSEKVVFGPVAGARNFFNPARASVLALSLLFFAMVLVFTRMAQKGVPLFVRRIGGLNAVEEAVGRATEMGRPVLYVPGIAEIDDIQTIASLTILSHVAKITARYETPIIVPTARSVVMSAAEEIVKEAHAEAGHPDTYNPDNIRYLSDAQFAFAAAVNGIMLREKPAANLYLGAFWAESLLLAETGFEAGAIQVAGTANVSQLPFFVTACDFTLLGEELYAASAYLSREPKLLGGLKGSDWMKVVSIGLMVAGIVANLLGATGLVNWFQTR